VRTGGTISANRLRQLMVWSVGKNRFEQLVRMGLDSKSKLRKIGEGKFGQLVRTGLGSCVEPVWTSL
jgi:hypothetical protein